MFEVVRSLTTLCYLLFILAPASAEVNVAQNRREARTLIEQRYYNSQFEVTAQEALAKLKENFASPNVAAEDYLLAAWIHFVKNRGLGAKSEEEDIGEAINILNQAATKYSNNVEIVYAKYYYSQFSKERFQRELSTKEVEELNRKKLLTPEQLAVYFLKTGAISQSSSYFEKFLAQNSSSSARKADAIERYGDLLLSSGDATLARSCLETFERAITERPEVSIYYVKAAECAIKGLNFDRAHLYYRNAYDRQKSSTPYKDAYANSLALQFVMKKEKWETQKMVDTLNEAFTLSPSFGIFALRFSVAIEKEGENEQKEQLARGEEIFGEKVYDLYIYLYQKSDVNFSESVKKDLLERIIALAKDKKDKLHFAFTSFLEGLSFNQKLGYDRAKYARAYKLAKAYYQEQGAMADEVSLYSFLYLLQFFKTKDFNKLTAAKSLLNEIERSDSSRSPGTVEEFTRDLIQKIASKSGYEEHDASFKIKELLAPTLESSLGFALFDFKLEEQEFSSLTFKEKYKEEFLNKLAPKDIKAEVATSLEEGVSDDDEDEEKAGTQRLANIASEEKIQEDNKESIDFINKVREFFGAKDYQAAINLCLTGLQKEELKSYARSCLSDSYHELKNYTKALKYIEESLTADPSNKTAVMDKAHILDAHMEQLGAHRNFVYESHKQFPGNELVTSIKEKLLYQSGMGSMDEYMALSAQIASGKYSKALKARTLMNVGNIYYTKQDILKAVKSYNSCIKMSEKKYSKKCKDSLAGVCRQSGEDKKIKIYCLRS